VKFGVMLDPHVEKWELVKHAEELGYDRAWIPDSEMIWSDCYATLALAAVNTSRIQIGTGVAIPGTRIAPVTANAIASINQLAPGRTFLGIGTGHTAMRLLGQPPVRVQEFREHIRVVRALLDGEAVEFTHNGRTAEIQFMHQDLRYFNLTDRIPIYIAGNGPKALRTTGELGDGWITAGGIGSGVFSSGLDSIRGAAKDANRTLPADFLACNTISACVLRPGEKLTDDRVIDQTGSVVTMNLHFTYELWNDHGRPDNMIPHHFADYWEDFVKKVEGYPEAGRFRYIHDGHATFLQPNERKYVTPEAIKASVVVGEPDEIAQHLRDAEASGVTEVALLPPAEFQRDVFTDFAEHVIPQFR
jgi:alkanesulfonate monooxygenase SsuD/methylene tetrahydromethanopterin reductase-like flavin-dependent oxidoreductase (luciferase family)